MLMPFFIVLSCGSSCSRRQHLLTHSRDRAHHLTLAHGSSLR
jgi:hypothetical protein